MKFFAKLLVMGGLLAASAAPALADPIDSVAFNGFNTYSNTSITFNNPGLYNGTLNNAASAGMVTFGPNPLTSYTLNYTPFVNPTLFATFAGTGVSFYMTSLAATAGSTTSGGITIATETLSGTGYFLFNGVQTLGAYTLTTQGNGLTTFSASAMNAATPEPSSLLLLGTGLFGAAGMLFRKRMFA